jgi:chromosomal replication initiation ATPase DnaA
LSGFKGHTFTDRQQTAAEAKKALLEKFKSRIDDPELAAKREEHLARAEARKIREAEKAAAALKRAEEEAASKAEAERLAAIAKAEWEAEQAKLRPRSNANRSASADMIARVIADHARIRAQRASGNRKTGS